MSVYFAPVQFISLVRAYKRAFAFRLYPSLQVATRHSAADYALSP